MNRKGSVLILSLLVTSILLLFGWIFLSLTVTNYQTLTVSSNELKAFWIAKAGISKALYELRDDYSQYIYDVKKVDFSDGEYEIAIASLDTTGVRNILCVSNAKYQNSTYSMLTEIQLDTPTDYLYFFDGNGEFGSTGGLSDIEIGGPIHSNAHFRATTYTAHIWFIKPPKISGPLISTAGLITRSMYYKGHPYSIIDEMYINVIGVKLGEGEPSFDQNFMYTGIVPDKLLDFPRFGFQVVSRPGSPSDIFMHNIYLITYPDDFSSSDWAKTPVTPSPSETYPTSNTPLGLLNDGYHGAYRIHIPTIRKSTPGVRYKATEYADLPIKTDTEWENEIKNFYADYIDERWYIRGKKLTDSYGNKYYAVEDSNGLATKEFVNDLYRRKFVIGKGDGTNTQFTIPSHYVSGIEKIGKQDSGGSLTTFKYFPSTRRIKNIYFNGVNVNTLPAFSAYYQSYANSYVPAGADSYLQRNSKIAFDTAPSTNIKNIKARFKDNQVFRIGRGDGSKTNFEYYPGTISGVYVYSGSAWQPVSWIPGDVDHTVTAATLTTTDNITYETPEKILPGFFKSDTVEIYINAVSIYSGYGGAQPAANDPNISSIDYVKGRITFKNSQAGNTITAKYFARAITITSGAPPAPSSGLGNVGIVYSGDITVAEGYNSSNSDGSGPAREFNFEPQDANTKISKVTIDTTSAYYIVADYYGIIWSLSEGYGSWGEIVFSSTPPANTVIGTDYANKGVYIIVGAEPKYSSSIHNDAIPGPTGKYRFYDYTITGNSINIKDKGASSVGYQGIQEPSPIPPDNSLVCLDPPVKAVVIDLGNVNPGPSKGVIFSEVPVIVKGRAKEPILIVSLGDVYLHSINSGLTDDSEETSPVGILSTGAVWVDYNGAYELDENHPGDNYYDVILNKVAIYTTKGFYYTGGKFWRNRLRLVGSVCILSNDFGTYVDKTDMGSYYYTDIIKLLWTYAYSNTGGNAQLYATSFRGEKTTATSSNHRPPPHMPVYIQTKYFKSSSSTNAQKFIDTIKGYIIDKQKIPQKVYNELMESL